MSVNQNTNLKPSLDKLLQSKELRDSSDLNKNIKTKQEILIPGVNLKRINGESLVGSGNITLDELGVEIKLTGGDNISIDRTDPNNPIISATGLTSESDYSKSFLLGGM